MDEKIKSMAIKRFEIEIREKERHIQEKVFGAIYERRIGKKVFDQQLSYSIANKSYTIPNKSKLMQTITSLKITPLILHGLC